MDSQSIGIDQSFEVWMKEADRLCGASTGMSLYDLPDCCYRDWYDDGMTPKQAVRMALRSANE